MTIEMAPNRANVVMGRKEASEWLDLFSAWAQEDPEFKKALISAIERILEE